MSNELISVKNTDYGLTTVSDKRVVDTKRTDGKQEVIITNQGLILQRTEKLIVVNKQSYKIDAEQLMRMVKNVTQTIGEYKGQENPYSAYIINSLRSARSHMVSDLEHHFKIHWEIDKETGESHFYY